MPEKMTIASREPSGAALPDGAAVVRLCGVRDERENGVEDRGELGERRAEQAAAAGRVEDSGDPAQQVAEQVAGALDGVDAELDLVRTHDEAEQVQVDRAEVEREDRARGTGRKRRQRRLARLRRRVAVA